MGLISGAWRTATLAGLFVVAVFAAHCSSSQGDDAEAGNSAVRDNDFASVCTDVWTRRCAEWKTCLPDSFKAEFTSEADCTLQRATICENHFRGESVNATAPQLKACYDADKALDCTQLTRVLFDPNADGTTTNADPACAAISPGALADGTSCAFNAECSGGACIRSGECGVCATKQTAGGPCTVNEHCMPGLSCGAQHKCTTLVDLGGDCSIADCHTDLLCQPGGEAGTTPTCVKRPSKGEACNAGSTSVACHFYAGEMCDVTTSTCQPHGVGKLGDSCLLALSVPGKFAFRDFCGPGLHCAQNSQRAVCAPTTQAGEGCFFSRGPDGSQCGAGLKCVNNGLCAVDEAAACKGYAPAALPTGPNPLHFPVFPNLGGPLLKTVKMVTVTFPGFAYRDHVRALGDYLFASGWYATAGAPYGVGKGSTLPPVELDELPPNAAGVLSNLDMQDFLVRKIKEGKLPTPAAYLPDQGTYFMVYLPQTLVVSGAPYGTTCQNLGAYHDVVAAPYAFNYGVVANCAAASGLTEEQILDSGASHELLEGATNALNFSPAFQLAKPNPWYYTGAEVTDVCQGSYLNQGGFLLARTSSNVEAVAGRDPCIPSLPGAAPYYNVTTDAQTKTATPGTTVPFTLSGFSTAARGDWTLLARTLTAPPGFTAATFDVTTINVGKNATLSVPIPPLASRGSVIAIDIRSHDPADPAYYFNQQTVSVTVQ